MSKSGKALLLPLLVVSFILHGSGCGGSSGSNDGITTPSPVLPAHDQDRIQDESNQPEGPPTVRTSQEEESF